MLSTNSLIELFDRALGHDGVVRRLVARIAICGQGSLGSRSADADLGVALRVRVCATLGGVLVGIPVRRSRGVKENPSSASESDLRAAPTPGPGDKTVDRSWYYFFTHQRAGRLLIGIVLLLIVAASYLLA